MTDYPQILYIDPEDNIDRIREHIKLSNKEKIILVLPEENKNLKNVESLTILKKESQNFGKKVTIYSTDPYYKRLAEDCGLEIEESLIGGSFLDKKGEVSFRPSVSDILPKKETTEEEPKEIKKIFVEEKSIQKEKVLTQEEEVKKPEEKIIPTLKAIPQRKISPFFYIFLFSLVAAAAILAITWLPKADIVIIPTSEKVDFSGNFSVERGAKIDLKNNVLPGTIFSKEKEIEKTFSATNEQEKSEKATGIIKIYNKDTSSHKFVTGTRFEFSDGKIFRSQSAVSVPVGSSENPGIVDVNVVADKAGAEYNIASGDFTLPGLKGTALYDKISGKSSKAMAGGFVGVTKVISKSDIATAQKEVQSLQKKASEDLGEEILKNFPKNIQFLKDAIVVENGEIAFDKKEGEIGDSFKGKVSVKVKVLTFKEEDIRKIISRIVAGKIKDGIEFQEVLETQKIEYKLSDKEKSLKKLEITFGGEESVAWKVDENEIKKAVLGKNPEEFKKYITEGSKGKIKDAQLSLWPFYVNKIPTLQNRLFIKIQYK